MAGTAWTADALDLVGRQSASHLLTEFQAEVPTSTSDLTMRSRAQMAEGMHLTGLATPLHSTLDAILSTTPLSRFHPSRAAQRRQISQAFCFLFRAPRLSGSMVSDMSAWSALSLPAKLGLGREVWSDLSLPAKGRGVEAPLRCGGRALRRLRQFGREVLLE